MKGKEDFWGGAEVIHTVTRARLIEDGFLVEAPPEVARQAGIVWPVCFTRAAWERAVACPPGAAAAGQSVVGRLWDVFVILRLAIKASRKQGRESEITFPVFVRTGGPAADAEGLELIELKSVAGPDDAGRGCLTIMLPWED